MANRKRKKYVRRSATQWASLVSEQAESGLSQRRFCERHGLSYASFCYRKRRLGEERGDSQRGFIELAVDRATDESRWDVELSLGDGVVLRIRRS